MSKSSLVDHVILRVKNLEKSKEFYRAIAETLGHTITEEAADHFFVDGLQITQNDEPTQSLQLAFKASNPATVKLFHDAALKCGGECVAAPHIFHGPSQVYSTLVRDPDGNNLEVVYHQSRIIS